MTLREMLVNFKRKIQEHSAMVYTLLVLFTILILQRLDRFVFWDLELYKKPMAYRYSWWTFLGILTLLVAAKIYLCKKHLVLSLMLPWFCWSGILDFFYLVDIPLPVHLWNPNRVWDWSIAYLLFEFPWTIVHQIPWSFAWLFVYYLLYKRTKT